MTTETGENAEAYILRSFRNLKNARNMVKDAEWKLQCFDKTLYHEKYLNSLLRQDLARSQLYTLELTHQIDLLKAHITYLTKPMFIPPPFIPVVVYPITESPLKDPKVPSDSLEATHK